MFSVSCYSRYVYSWSLWYYQSYIRILFTGTSVRFWYWYQCAYPAVNCEPVKKKLTSSDRVQTIFSLASHRRWGTDSTSSRLPDAMRRRW